MHFHFTGSQGVYHGKVRDVYTVGNNLLVMVASNRISAFDVVLPEPIPYKGQVLNQIAAYMLEACRDICPNWLISVPAPQVSIGKKCEPFKVEMVIRGHLTGHAWRTYNSGLRTLCGVDLPDGMRENEAFRQPIITPTTKASVGHDEDISAEEIITRGIVSEADYRTLEMYTRKLFERGKQIASAHGLILVDTKYEFGKIGDTIYLMDEIHTPDSSRYFYAEGFKEKLAKNEKQRQLSKEFVREWLIANNFMGKEGQSVPDMDAEWIDTISKRYIELYETVTGKTFSGENWTKEDIEVAVNATLEKLEAEA